MLVYQNRPLSTFTFTMQVTQTQIFCVFSKLKKNSNRHKKPSLCIAPIISPSKNLNYLCWVVDYRMCVTVCVTSVCVYL